MDTLITIPICQLSLLLAINSDVFLNYNNAQPFNVVIQVNLC